MKTRLLTLALVLLFNTCIFSQVIWDGPTTTFTKADFANWELAENQDRITSNVWITRQDTQGIFNRSQETFYSSSSPKDTEWAVGTTSNLGSLTFYSWSGVPVSPPARVGLNMVVHLISDGIYIDIKFTSWTQGSPPGGNNGGGFSYQRSTDPGLGTEDFSISKFTISPNPSHSEIKLNFSQSSRNASVEVFDILGKQVYSKTEYENPINISDWEKGIYLIKVSDRESAQTKKFIKN